ncbi:hypothetical protein ACE4ZU_26610, partial [Salmonella enterica]|uniref:hypothetical protein n=1 Tax=Salmonella enterica TaxID=28901 RepID=UPI003D2CD41E
INRRPSPGTAACAHAANMMVDQSHKFSPAKGRATVAKPRLTIALRQILSRGSTTPASAAPPKPRC